LFWLNYVANSKRQLSIFLERVRQVIILKRPWSRLVYVIGSFTGALVGYLIAESFVFETDAIDTLIHRTTVGAPDFTGVRPRFVSFSQEEEPEKEPVAEAKKLLAEVYKQDFKAAEATSAPKKYELLRSLAEKIAGLLNTETDKANRFAIFEVSIDIAKRSGDIEYTCNLVDRFEASYAVSDEDPRLKVFDYWFSDFQERLRGSERQSAFEKLIEKLAPKAESAKQKALWENSEKYFRRLKAYSEKTTNRMRTERYERELIESTRLWKLSQRVESLKEGFSVPDSKANLEIGAYYCFELFDWKTGIPYLQKASDERIAKVANLDATCEKSAWQVVGDEWWNLADDYPNYSNAMRTRAADYYSRCIPEATGLNLGRLQGRLEKQAKQNGVSVFFTKSKPVELGLRWLAKQQKANGAWSLVGPYLDGASNENLTAATAMAILAYFGAGENQLRGSYQEKVRKGLSYLVKKADAKGFFAEDEIGNSRMYSQALATLAIIEAYQISRDDELRRIAQRAIIFAEQSQSKEGGWRYAPKEGSDTSVTGWFIEAITAGKKAGLAVDAQVLSKASEYLDSVSSDKNTKYKYQAYSKPTLTMTASGLNSRICLGWSKNDPAFSIAVKNQILPHVASDDDDNLAVYFLYYSTKVVAFTGGENWKQWRTAIEAKMDKLQITQGPEMGSIEPDNDVHSTGGGRLYTTCLMLYARQIVDRNGK
jgi:hypothetical protein